MFILFGVFAEFIFRGRSLPTADLAKMGCAYALERNGCREGDTTGRDLPSELLGRDGSLTRPPIPLNMGRTRIEVV